MPDSPPSRVFPAAFAPPHRRSRPDLPLSAKKASLKGAGERTPRARNFSLETAIVHGLTIRLMAKVTHGPIVSEARGKAAGLVYTKSRGGNVVKALSLTPPVVAATDGCALLTSIDLTVPVGSNYHPPFDKHLYDNGGMHSDSVNNSRITIRKAGVYLITAAPTFYGPADELIQTYVWKNGTTGIQFTSTQTRTGYFCTPTMAFCVHLAVNDYLELLIYIPAGGSPVIWSHYQNSPIFGAQQLTAA